MVVAPPWTMIDDSPSSILIFWFCSLLHDAVKKISWPPFSLVFNLYFAKLHNRRGSLEVQGTQKAQNGGWVF